MTSLSRITSGPLSFGSVHQAWRRLDGAAQMAVATTAVRLPMSLLIFAEMVQQHFRIAGSVLMALMLVDILDGQIVRLSSFRANREFRIFRRALDVALDRTVVALCVFGSLLVPSVAMNLVGWIVAREMVLGVISGAWYWRRRAILRPNGASRAAMACGGMLFSLALFGLSIPMMAVGAYIAMSGIGVILYITLPEFE